MLDSIEEIVSGAVESGGIPGVVAAAGRGPMTLGTWTAGLADTTPGAERPMGAEIVFDLASLTKVVSTTTVVLALAAAGALDLDAPVSRYLPAAPWNVTIRQLLAHSSGLPGSVTFYEWCATRDELLAALYGTALETPPGTRVAYSDLGFMALGEMISAVAGVPLDIVFRDLVALPLGLTETFYIPLDSPSASAPSVSGAAFSPASGAAPPLPGAAPSAAPGGSSGAVPSRPPAPMPAISSPLPAERFAATEFRDDGTPWTGIVHDENARVLGGVAGHAGLFSPVADLARFAEWWVSTAGGPVPAALRREAETCQTPGLNGRRGLGWVKPGDRFDILAGAWPATAVSHTGFTGTSIALDSATGAWLILLTNRVQFGRDLTAIRSLRRALHTAAAALAT